MIREAAINDKKTLAALYKELMVYHNRLAPQKYKIPDDEACEKRFDFVLNKDNYRGLRNEPFLLCYEENGIVNAYAYLEIYETYFFDGTKYGGFAVIEEIIVSEKFRRSGIGTELIREVCALAKEHHCETLGVKVRANNDGARKFYEKIGLLPESIEMEMRL